MDIINVITMSPLYVAFIWLCFRDCGGDQPTNNTPTNQTNDQ
jgi:hypothetical protein